MLSMLLAAFAAAAPLPPAPPAATLSGRVTDSAGMPLAAVRITVIEAKRSAVTDPEGHYSIPRLPRGTYGVSFSYIGYQPQVLRVAIGDSDVTLDVALRPTLVELPALQVTATPIATTALNSPQPTSVLTGSDLQGSLAPTLGATLDGLAGVRNYSTGQGIGKPVIRGLTSNRILILADGQRLENQQWGDEHGPNIGSADAERIEVIRGPASVLYGSDAIGGVINVVPREIPDALGRPSFVRGELSGGFATNGDAPDGTLMLEGASGVVGFRGSLSGRRSGNVDTPAGELFNSGGRAAGGSGAVGVRGGWGTVTANLAYRDERIEIHEDPAEDAAATPFQRVGDGRAAVNVNLPFGASRLEVDAGYEQNRRREFEANDDSELALGLLDRTFTTNAHFHHTPVGPFAGIVGASYMRNDFTKSGAETLVPNHGADNLAAYLFEQTELGRWAFSVGARYDHRVLDVETDDALGVTRQTRTYNSVTGNLGALYRVAEPAAIVLNLGRGFRAPSAFDLFANGVHEGTLRFERGNPGLENEMSFNTDLAFRLQSGRLSAEIGTFLNLIDNYIFPDPTGEIDPESGLQIFDIAQGNARLTGVEATAEYHPTSFLHLRATADYTHGQNTTRDQPLPFVAPFRVTYGAKLEGKDQGPFEAPYVSVNGETNTRQTRIDPDDFAPPGYTLVNLGAGTRFTAAALQFAIDLSVRNLFDTRYASFLSRYKTYAYDPGRNVALRVTTAF